MHQRGRGSGQREGEQRGYHLPVRPTPTQFETQSCADTAKRTPSNDFFSSCRTFFEHSQSTTGVVKEENMRGLEDTVLTLRRETHTATRNLHAARSTSVAL